MGPLTTLAAVTALTLQLCNGLVFPRGNATMDTTDVSFAAGLQIIDTAAAGGCTGGGSCCMPSCTVIFAGECGCHGSVAWSGACRQQRGKSTQKVSSCKNFKMTWDTAGSGYVSLDSPNCSMGWPIIKCNMASVGGGQCAPSGGGCKV